MNQGRIEQIGSPESVYERPASAFAYEFLGNVNRFECTITGGQAVFAGGAISVSEDVGGGDGAAIAYVRPHDIEVFTGPAVAALAATVRYISAAGPLAKVEVATDDGRLIEVELARPALRALALKIGSTVHIRARKARVFRRDAEPQPGEEISVRGEGSYPEGENLTAAMWHI